MKSTIEFIPLVCPVCGILFGMPEATLRLWARDRRGYCCPNGHAIVDAAPQPTPPHGRPPEDAGRIIAELSQQLAEVKGAYVTARGRLEQLEAAAEATPTILNIVSDKKE